MFPNVHPNFGKGDPGNPIVIGTGSRASGAGAVVLPAGAQPGDILVVCSIYGSLSGGAGWLTGGGLTWRRLLASDLAAGVFTANGTVVWTLYRGFYSIAFRTSGSDAAGGPTLAGFTKAANCAGLLIAAGTNAPIGGAPGMGPPWVVRTNVNGPSPGPGCSLNDLLDQAAYTSAAAIPVSGSVGFGSTTTAYAHELLF